MVGRAARILKTVPVQVQVFKIRLIDYESGLAITEVVLMRQSIRENELAFDGPEILWGALNFDNPSTKKNGDQVFQKINLFGLFILI